MDDRERLIKELKELCKSLTIYGDSEIFDVVFLDKIKKDPYVALELARAVAYKTVDGCADKFADFILVDRTRIIAKVVANFMCCNCDLDNYEPTKETGHSSVCQIHKKTLTLAGLDKGERL